MNISRFGVSLETSLLEDLDHLVERHKFPNRSQAIRYLIRKNLVEEKWKDNAVVAGSIVLVYDHHKRDLSNQMISIQHDREHLVLSVQHVHLDHALCLESIAVKGRASELVDLADRLIALKGITHGQLVMTALE